MDPGCLESGSEMAVQPSRSFLRILVVGCTSQGRMHEALAFAKICFVRVLPAILRNAKNSVEKQGFASGAKRRNATGPIAERLHSLLRMKKRSTHTILAIDVACQDRDQPI
jgi:hypothetical protein